MATEWFFERDGERHGPVSSSNLKQLAANGKIRPDDLIWQSEMEDWMPARSVKGLLGVQSQSTPPPLPTDRAKEKTPVVPVSDQLKAGASVIGSSAKVAGQLAAKQTEKSNILNGSLPKAFAVLGKNTFENAEATSELESCYAEINGVIERIETIAKKTSNQPEAKTFTEKAKALASTTGAAAQTKMLQHKLKQQYSRLGKLVFEDSDNGPESIRSPITKLKDRLSELDVEIGELKKQMSAQKEAAGKMVSSVAASGGSLLFKTGVVGTLAVFCAPVGLALIWLHPTWDKSRKLRWTGVSVACLLVFFVLGRMQQSAVLKELAEANRLWDDGDQTAAIDGYREVLSNVSLLPQADRSRVFRRVIEFDCEHDNLESAKKLIGNARRVGIELSLTNSKARTLLADIEREQAQKEQEQKKQETAKAIQPPETGSGNSGALSLKNGPVPIDDFLKVFKWEQTTSKDGANIVGSPFEFVTADIMGRFEQPYRYHLGRLGVGRVGYEQRHATVMLLQADEDRKLVGIIVEYEGWDMNARLNNAPLRPLSSTIKEYVLPGFSLVDVVVKDPGLLLGSGIQTQYGTSTVKVTFEDPDNDSIGKFYVWIIL